MTEIRRANLADVAALSRLSIATFNQAFAHLYKPEDLEEFLTYNHAPSYYEDFLNDPKAAVWVAVNPKGEMIGYCTAAPCCLPAPDMPENSGELCRLYLLPECQGQGIGKTFLDTALAWIETHFDHTYIGVFSENAGAQKLYKSYGFEKVAEYHFLVGKHPDLEWIMKRRSQKA